MFGLGWTEVVVIVGVALLIFGPKKIPEIGSNLGKTLREFKDEINSSEDEYFDDKN
ncbi:MAG: twin-arginine translocase TatA/TatE family subunit [cyanobacterium endosymbiont of Rhopalodia musculus]|uniref:twin-arginine translocase TatA/TatE family subunit n=1 Tax=cyanobacterium endosymbiont of Epithemia clementina EcSB TaxID=3034674 RepID=UPI0024803F45|nr:twin-arginine translocase TatA/TatE family subunit [cyanobacterium endosymbiont of Epithemia clementina EcSB]WGT66823.1 twin-arginine translocase TatA/TatE family subunit [cyanobacterium endosymbiont of Epithemia clementina EcSB]